MVQGILFNDLNTKEPVNPSRLGREFFQEPWVDVGSRYTVRGLGGTGGESECWVLSLAVPLEPAKVPDGD